MTRDEAQAEVSPFIQHVEQYQAVLHSDALSVLGQERFDRLSKDPLRKLGPSEGCVYPWNVVDYIYQPDLGRKAVSAVNVTCPDCNGDKQRVGLFPKYRDDVPQEDRKAVIFFDCQRCKGIGEVPGEMFQWIEAGKRLKADRQKGGMALREFCISNGIDPLTRSHRESGYIDPETPDLPFEWPHQSVA